ncbi:uncharacterized protein LOC111257964 [Setaria italica]|uniref:uncharacterized protein LOC111257964 n=1 Tax=Setaria italica TaxID=4555 RepID=UPI000BE5AC8B|nr:uncharacterized protein LOC111257964 [Setaria italica]
MTDDDEDEPSKKTLKGAKSDPRTTNSTPAPLSSLLPTHSLCSLSPSPHAPPGSASFARRRHLRSAPRRRHLLLRLRLAEALAELEQARAAELQRCLEQTYGKRRHLVEKARGRIHEIRAHLHEREQQQALPRPPSPRSPSNRSCPVSDRTGKLLSMMPVCYYRFSFLNFTLGAATATS